MRIIDRFFPLATGLSASAMAFGLAFPTALSAQASAAPAEEAVADIAPVPAAADNDNLIVVTGTRIESAAFDIANPVVSFSETQFVQSGEIDLADLLVQVPALNNSRTDFDMAGDQAAVGTAGLNLLDLRNLGVDRTLVLINGRRQVSSLAGQTSVDINTIPNSLVERVDVLTGGVSAIYGADGVSGVVNFVMKRDFEGLDLRLQKGVSDEGDAGSTLVSIVAGKNFADDRGNIALAYDYRGQERLSIADRPVGQPGARRLVRNPADFPDDPNVPDNILLGDLRFLDTSPDGAVFIDPSFFAGGAPVFNGDGTLYDGGTFLPGSGRVIGGDSTPVASYGGDLQPEKDAHIVNLLASYEFTPSLRLFAEGKYARTEAYTEAQPTFDSMLFISAEQSPFVPFATGNNPFIPASIRSAFPLGNFGAVSGVFVARDNFDFGRRSETTERDLYRGVLGFEGDLTDNLRFEVSYTYGRSDVKTTQHNVRIADRFYAALDAVDEGEFLGGPPNGNIVCLIDITGGGPVSPLNNYNTPAQTFTPGSGECQPLNIFGNGSPSQAALDFFLTDLETRSRLQQHVLSGYVSGDFGDAFALPGGPVSFAVGAEYREEKSRFDPDPLASQPRIGNPNSSVLLDLQLVEPEQGRFDVIEGFAELSAPILSDAPLAYRLQVDGAVRVSDYSTVGTTTSWKLGGFYAPVRDVTFRGSYSHAVRAPNISELFGTQTGTVASIADPCDIDNVDDGYAPRAANCVALLGNLGVAPGTFDPDAGPTSLRPGLGRGNAGLKEEKARTWTAGVLLQPQFAPGLTASFDWYDIRIRDAIISARPQQFVNLCVDQTSIDNVFCANVTRAPSGAITGFTVRPYNVSAIETAGADVTVNYAFAPADLGAFNLRGTVGYLDKLKYRSAPGVIENRRGFVENGTPKWVATGDISWRKGGLLLNYGLNYVGKQSFYSDIELANNPDIAPQSVIDVKAGLTHDIRAELFTDNGFSFYVGSNNFTDEKPDEPLLSAPTGYMGRYLYAGIRASFDDFGF